MQCLTKTSRAVSFPLIPMAAYRYRSNLEISQESAASVVAVTVVVVVVVVLAVVLAVVVVIVIVLLVVVAVVTAGCLYVRLIVLYCTVFVYCSTYVYTYRRDCLVSTRYCNEY